MIAIQREFVVEVPQEAAWQGLSQIERWPSWARHIKRVEVIPAGELGPESKGVVHLTNGLKSEFTITELNPYRNWKWVGTFLWLTIYYDHVFVPVLRKKSKTSTRLRCNNVTSTLNPARTEFLRTTALRIQRIRVIALNSAKNVVPFASSMGMGKLYA